MQMGVNNDNLPTTKKKENVLGALAPQLSLLLKLSGVIKLLDIEACALFRAVAALADWIIPYLFRRHLVEQAHDISGPVGWGAFAEERILRGGEAGLSCREINIRCTPLQSTKTFSLKSKEFVLPTNRPTYYDSWVAPKVLGDVLLVKEIASKVLTRSSLPLWQQEANTRSRV